MSLPPVFGMPPKYGPSIDYNNRVYSKLWGNLDRKGTLTDTNLYSIKMTVGTPKRVRLGLLTTLANRLNNVTDLSRMESEYQKLEQEWSSKTSSGLNTFQFGSAYKSGTNTYLSIVDNLIEMMGYGLRTQGVPDEKNPYYDINNRVFSTMDANLRFPSITVLGSEETSISESISNEVGDSKLKGMLDKSSEMMREFSFINGGGGSIEKEIESLANGSNNKFIKSGFSMLNDGISLIKDSATKVIGKDMVNIIAEGNQIMMPQVWKNSSFSKKYTISFKLSSPYSDAFSIARNINIPLAYILGMSLPIQKGPNTLSFPYLVQIDSPGAIAVSMGMVTNVSIKKGGTNDVWSNQSVYRAIDVTMEVVDLFEVLPVPMTSVLSTMNKETRDFLGNLAGGKILLDKGERNKQMAESIQYAAESREFGAFDIDGMQEEFLRRNGTIAQRKTANYALKETIEMAKQGYSQYSDVNNTVNALKNQIGF